MSSDKIKHYTIPVFVPELACPFQCVFCDQRKISGHEESPDLKEVRITIEEHLNTIPKAGSHIEIGFFGGNFTGIDPLIQEMYLGAAADYLSAGRIHGIRLSTRPDYISPEKLHMLKHYGVSSIELGAQSLDPDVLRLSGRGHKTEDIEEASRLIIQDGFSLGLQMMLGLPGDTPEKSVFTARRIVELGAGNTRVYPTLVIKGTKLHSLYLSGKYRPLELGEAVSQAKEVTKIFEEARVSIIRMGLHPSEGLLSGEDLAAGPYHVSFRELVATEIWNEILKPLSTKKGKVLTISVPPSEFNYAVGYNGRNKKELLVNFHKVRFISDPSLEERQFRADYN
ncbi:MAG TPA: radical SAM protein [Ignavibacteriales bacterium]|nr:radical SAM protein [Ignavibacteriales bacterium]